MGRKTNVGVITLTPSFIQDLLGIADQSYNAHPDKSALEYKEFRENLPRYAGKKIYFTVYTRSVEGILYYLGGIVRHQLKSMDGDSPRLYKLQIEKSFVARKFHTGPCETETEETFCDNFFVLNKGLGPSPLAVVYKGQRYAVPEAESERGDTLHVLSIVKQLLAINTSAKSLPQTNVLSVSSP